VTKDLHARLQAHLDGTAGAGPLADLEEALRRDPALRRELLVLAAFDAELPAALRELAHERAAAPARTATPGGTGEPAPAPAAGPVPVRPRFRLSSGWILWPAAAAAAAVAAFKILAPTPKPVEQAIARVEAPRPAGVRPAAVASPEAATPPAPAPVAAPFRVRAIPAGPVEGAEAAKPAPMNAQAAAADGVAAAPPLRRPALAARAMRTPLELEEGPQAAMAPQAATGAAPRAARAQPRAMAMRASLELEDSATVQAAPMAMQAAPMAARGPEEGVVGRLTAVSGDVHIVRAGAGRIPAAGAMEVRAGDVVTTGARASATLAGDDGVTLRIHGSTRVSLGRTPAGPVLEIRAGVVDASVAKRPGDSRASVRGGALTADTSEAEFRLVVRERSAWLGVRSGRVGIARASDGKRIELDGGAGAAVDPDQPYEKFDARSFPAWQAVCRETAGTPYP